jgi:tetratricopeptide (TPR) repeat protein
MQSDYDNHLQNYFTDMEYLRGIFKDFVSTTKLSKRLIVLHGVGGVGKSSLLSMFRLECKSEKIPVALASGDDAKSVLDILTRWAEDLKTDGIKLPTLGKTLETYRFIQAKVDEQAKKTQESRNKMADIAGKAASKTAETAGGALMGAAIGSVIPGLGTAIGGTLGGVLGGMGAEALTDWLRGFLAKPDIDLLLDPAKRLTADFLEDTAKAAEKKRIVLLLDTFEQMTALEDWVGELAQKIHPNILMVVAGRKLPDWNRSWPGWMAIAQVEELKPMTEEVMRDLVRRYYATMRGGEPDPTQVEAIVRFARGLPMVVTSAVQLWVKYGVEDFQSVKAEIVANLVDRLMEGVPPALIPALEAAAVVRWFDQPILRAVIQQEDVRNVYNELRRFPFIRTRAEGLALHDSVREMIDENLRVQDSERHCELHNRAATYFEKRLENVDGEEAERLGLEKLYHRIRENERKNLSIFIELAKEFTRYRLINRLRIMLNDVDTYHLEFNSSRLWREYYNAQLAQLEERVSDTENIYIKIGADESIEPRLRAYALSELGRIRSSMKYVRVSNGLSELVHTIERSNEMLPKSSSKRAENFVTLGIAYPHVGEVDKANDSFEKAIQLYREINDMYGVSNVFRHMITMYGIRGEWAKMFDVRSRGLTNLPETAKESYVYSGLLGRFAIGWVLAGRYVEAEEYSQAALSINEKLGIIDLAGSLDDLVISFGFQEKFSGAHDFFKKSKENSRKLHNRENPVSLNFYGMVLIREGSLLDAEKYLQASFAINENLPPRRNPPENLQWLGLLYELKQEWQKAEEYNAKSLEYRWIGRQYYICAALTSLIRVKHALGDHAAIPPLLAEAEQLAQQYEYNDHLASLRLTQGHLRAGSPQTSEAPKSGETSEVVLGLSALDYYKQAMIYAIRYNRFLLDELVGGRPQGTPLRPIIPSLLEHGEAGRKILVTLRDWWKTGLNDIGTPRPDTISPIPEGISLLEAEKIAREREPGDESIQKSVVEQFEAVL